MVNGEVKVPRNSPRGGGERVDLRIDAVVPEDHRHHGRVTVIVEVKGAWHRNLMQALPDQLASRYVAGVKGAHGIYLVLWPDLGTWAVGHSDAARRTIAGRDPDRVRAELRGQAAAASGNGYVVEVVDLDVSYRRPWSR